MCLVTAPEENQQLYLEETMLIAGVKCLRQECKLRICLVTDSGI